MLKKSFMISIEDVLKEKFNYDITEMRSVRRFIFPYIYEDEYKEGVLIDFNKLEHEKNYGGTLDDDLD